MGNGHFPGQEDFSVFARSRCPGLTLVTYGWRKFLPLKSEREKKEERTHGGVAGWSFVDEKAISPADIGALVWVLTNWQEKLGMGTRLIEFPAMLRPIVKNGIKSLLVSLCCYLKLLLGAGLWVVRT
jgi:hypothetical protein